MSILKGEEPTVRNALVLTFDDGYTNNFDYALPIMNSFDVPGVFYVPTIHVDEQLPFWFDRLDFALQKASEDCEEFDLAGVVHKGTDVTRKSLRALFENFRNELKKREISEQEFIGELNRIAENLEEKSGCSIANLKDDPWSAVASWEQLRTANSQESVTIGSHSVSHTRLYFANNDTVVVELTQSKRRIESEIESPCSHFAYPNGAYDNFSKQQVALAGYESAVTTEQGMNSIGDDIFALKRVYPPTAHNKFEMLAKVSGIQQSILALRSLISSRT